MLWVQDEDKRINRMQKELQRDIHYNIAHVPIRNDMTIYVIIFKSISIELHAAIIYYGYSYTNKTKNNY